MSFFSDDSESVEVGELKAKIKDLREDLRVQQVNSDITMRQLKMDNSLIVQQKDFDIAHLADERVQRAEAEKARLSEEVAVLKKEKEMLEKVVSIEADVVDVKELVKNLIAKLPEVNLKNLTINTNGNASNTA